MTTQTLDARLAKLKREVQRSWKRRAQPLRSLFPRTRPQDRLTAAVLALLKLTAIIAIPFVVFVRSSVFLYLNVGAPSWVAIAVAALLTFSVVAGYAAWLSRTLHGRSRARRVVRWVALPLVIAWCGYTLFYLAKVNAKSDAIRGYYMAVHPVLRVAVSTVILVDSDLMVTDMKRVPDDYPRMGLPVNNRTMHYRQADGWVHAVDLRTMGRGELKNRLVQLYFWTMGFSTLRHVGTADHLHVQLRLR